jgi:hypothetical protein
MDDQTVITVDLAWKLRPHSSGPVSGIYDFLAIWRYVHIQRWQDAKHAPVEHGPIKHAPDLPVCGVENFAFMDHRHLLGCQQSPATRAARFGVRRRISCPPAW